MLKIQFILKKIVKKGAFCSDNDICIWIYIGFLKLIVIVKYLIVFMLFSGQNLPPPQPPPQLLF